MQNGNWVVNTGWFGADNALGHINRSIKVSGALAGITKNPSDLAKFFLIAPEPTRLAEQAKDMAGVSINIQNQHHNLSLTVLSLEEMKVSNLNTTIAGFSNPFTQSVDYPFKLVTKIVIPDEGKRNLCV